MSSFRDAMLRALIGISLYVYVGRINYGLTPFYMTSMSIFNEVARINTLKPFLSVARE